MDETFEQTQARHRKEQRDLQSRVTSKKKNATKKTRKFVNDECAELERQLKERQEDELRKLSGDAGEDATNDDDDDDEQPPKPPTVAASLADALQSTSLSSSSSQPQPQQPQPQPPQPPAEPKQKRNRQKERLARRAAEQEAASLAASAEAASMPDHRAAEQTAMQAHVAAHALREHPIAPDGHCLFSAVADQLAGLDIPLSSFVAAAATAATTIEGEDGLKKMPPPYRVVRRAAADWIAAHREEYQGFLEEGVDGYVGKIRDTAEWGGQLELSALANAYGVEIRVLQGGGRVEVVEPGEEGEGDKKGEGEDKKKTLWLAYYRHGYGLGEHYNSLRKVEV
ncbi:hypothetical protein C8A00DRAFT_43238 [Chaetomidium leptoderma]|uniref:OTU domain-containing protein n=1 Tax=Chaetomidium leptoderma TaxID=669021 RepID=A0AAN6ZXI3_9PEZI|nr:hypothetical protein C8A00DRAFT_43238 [Chaetomidium leptoderma]